jgi:hypothetical protein
LPHGDPNKVYMLRTNGDTAHEVWDVTVPEAPVLVSTPSSGLVVTHKDYWDCSSGIAYLNSMTTDWSANYLQVYDLSNPEQPRFIRNFGLVNQSPAVHEEVYLGDGLHEATVYGDRVYLAYGAGIDGVVQILDRDRLLHGDPNDPFDPTNPTANQLAYPVIGVLRMPPFVGAHTAFPLLRVRIPDYAPSVAGQVHDFMVVSSETATYECGVADPAAVPPGALPSGIVVRLPADDRTGYRGFITIVDITDPHTPYPVSNFQVPAASGDFCHRGARFGPHSSNLSYDPVYYGRLMFFSYFNAGVRVVDVRDPFRPVEVGYYIPAVNSETAPTHGHRVVQTNNVEVDARGFAYIVDRAGGGLDILRLTGAAADIAPSPSSHDVQAGH